MSRYVVALRREARGLTVLADILELAGVSLSSASPYRALIDISPQKADELKARFGDRLIVEPEIMHDRY